MLCFFLAVSIVTADVFLLLPDMSSLDLAEHPQTYSPPIYMQVLQEGCRILGLEDVSLLGPSVEKLTKVVQVLPRLERFVNR